MAVDQSRLKDISSRLEALGYDPAVFAFERDPHAGPSHSHIGPEILVANTENAKQVRYKAGDDLAWRSQFIEDVRCGLFGPPPKGVPFGNANLQSGQH